MDWLSGVQFALSAGAIGGGSLFNLVTFIEELTELRGGAPAGSWLRTVVLLVASAGLFQLGLVAAVTDPRHGSEIIGIPMLGASVLGALALVLRLRRHLRRR